MRRVPGVLASGPAGVYTLLIRTLHALALGLLLALAAGCNGEEDETKRSTRKKQPPEKGEVST